MSKPKVAADIMETKLVTLRPADDVFDAIERLLMHRISGAPVVDEEGRLVGVLSELDCIHRLVASAYDNDPTTTVERGMSSQLRTVEPDTDLLTVAHFFLNNAVRRLPVVDATGRLLGQISRRDLLRALDSVMRSSPQRERALLYLSALHGAEQAPVP